MVVYPEGYAGKNQFRIECNPFTLGVKKLTFTLVKFDIYDIY